MHNFLSKADVSDPAALLAAALRTQAGTEDHSLAGLGKTLVLLFFNASLRTRLSTQRAAHRLGMDVISMNVNQGWGLEFEDGTVMDLDKAEHVREAAAVISQYADVIGIRTFAGLTDRDFDYGETVLRQFVRFASVPVVNLESATVHPLQSFTDWLTIEAHKTRPRPRVVLTWAPHPRALPQAVANSFLEWMRDTDYELILTHPPGYELAPEFVGDVAVVHDQSEALVGADFVYAKNWSSYANYGQIVNQDPAWMITPAKMALTNAGRFLHCLPVRRNVVVADAVLDGPQSLVIPQAANRAVTAEVVLRHLIVQSQIPHSTSDS